MASIGLSFLMGNAMQRIKTLERERATDKVADTLIETRDRVDHDTLVVVAAQMTGVVRDVAEVKAEIGLLQFEVSKLSAQPIKTFNQGAVQ